MHAYTIAQLVQITDHFFKADSIVQRLYGSPDSVTLVLQR